jgi:acetyl-CoA C-acetyltransferase
MTRVPMFSDCGGEESPLLKKHHPDLVQQGMAAEILSEQFKISRNDIDDFALRSQVLAKQAIDQNRFAKSIIPVPYKDENGAEKTLDCDDNPRPETTKEALAGLKTVFKPDGVITAGNASAIVDGAAAVLVASESALKRHSLKPRARIVSQISIGSPPRVMLTGPIEASRRALQLAGLKVEQIDLWEINEAFAVVAEKFIRDLKLDRDKVNVNGGAMALGHPIGATGSILIGTIIDELERRDLKRGLVTMCAAGGMAPAIIVERM